MGQYYSLKQIFSENKSIIANKILSVSKLNDTIHIYHEFFTVLFPLFFAATSTKTFVYRSYGEDIPLLMRDRPRHMILKLQAILYHLD